VGHAAVLFNPYIRTDCSSRWSCTCAVLADAIGGCENTPDINFSQRWNLSIHIIDEVLTIAMRRQNEYRTIQESRHHGEPQLTKPSFFPLNLLPKKTLSSRYPPHSSIHHSMPCLPQTTMHRRWLPVCLARDHGHSTTTSQYRIHTLSCTSRTVIPPAESKSSICLKLQ
jgi:hypothetical protein